MGCLITNKCRHGAEELQEDAPVPHPVKLRDMILPPRNIRRRKLSASISNFQDYLTRFR